MPSETTIRNGLGLRKFGNGRRWIDRLLACVVVATLGCDETPTLPPKPAAPPTSNIPGAITVGNDPAQGAAVDSTAAAQGSAVAPATPHEGEPAPGAAVEREKAVRGAGAQGRNYGGGVITEPVRQYFLLKQAAAFEIQIPHAMNLFKAEHNRFPKDRAEFDREILDPAGIRLPELPDGERYFYDAQQGELMVERPAPEAAK